MGAFAESIRRRLPLPVSDYMGLCNREYYGTRDPLGASGDFTTAPEISQIFGELIGAFIVHIWRVQGQQPFNLIEGGPGRGTLMADLLRATKGVSGFHEAADIHFLEVSETLRQAQKRALQAFHKNPRWASEISEITSENKNNILIFNEFFDALPVEQYKCVGGQWHQLVIDGGEGGLRLSTGPVVDIDWPYAPVAEGGVVEVAPVRTQVMKTVCELVAKGGLALAIDYGTGQWASGDTLQAMKAHKYVDALAEPGEVDLTSHVDFAALASVAQVAGLYVHPIMTQGTFLNHLGGPLRAHKLGKEADYARLVESGQMGELFKVMIVAHPDWAAALQEVLP